MTETAIAVALLFDDTELGGQLRDALQERGARIVHEGGVSSLSRDLLDSVGAEVLVINLDDAADDALDHVYDLLDGDRPRVVFNDAQASRALAGWDRARWARHLAVKVLAVGDIDPPRPEDARAIDTPQVPLAATDAVSGMEADDVAPPVAAIVAAETLQDQESSAEDLEELGELGHSDGQMASAKSEDLAAELEALLAAGDLPAGEENDAEHDPDQVHGDTMPADIDFVMPDDVPRDGVVQGLDDFLSASSKHVNAQASSQAPSSPSIDHLELAPELDELLATIPAASLPPPVSPATGSSAARAPDSWALLDEETYPAAASENPEAMTFGVEKVSAADYLAPDVEQASPSFMPVMSLELVSIEEAIAPRAYEHVSEMVLDDTGTALSRLVVLGAATAGMESVGEFLTALPSTTRLTFLLTLHSGEQTGDALIERLAAQSALPVRLARHAGVARTGEILVVPPQQQVRVRRDGAMDVQADTSSTTQSPSIDASFSMAANAFGRDVVAIVFAGRGTDAVGGSQAVHDRGGQVWVESTSGEHFADMVSGIFAERLVSFSGTPRELAAHLIEVFP